MYIEYRGEVSVQEIDNVVTALLEELPNGPIYIASETTGARFPINMISLRKLPELVRHPNLKHMALVQGSGLVEYLAKFLAVNKMSLHKNLPDAIAEAQKQAASVRR
jgi:hypothetical protein